MNVLVTGSGGLIGSQATRYYLNKGYNVYGIDNDMRYRFFKDPSSSTKPEVENLLELSNYLHYDTDIRDERAIREIFSKVKFNLIIHAAAQPSHDWPAVDSVDIGSNSTMLERLMDSSGPITDFTVNQFGTLVLLEATKSFSPDAVFIYVSTNKVYGDMPNKLKLIEKETRWDLDDSHPYYEGIPESIPMDLHPSGGSRYKDLFCDFSPAVRSLFGVDKLGAEAMVLEYGRNDEIAGGKILKTGVFRGGCLTGPAHAGTKLHGFLSYLVKCIYNGDKYIEEQIYSIYNQDDVIYILYISTKAKI